MCRYIDIYMGNCVDVYRAVYRTIHADNYKAFLVYQCYILGEL